MSKKLNKVKILLLGPTKSGKTNIANYLADLKITLPEDFSFTKPLRIVEYEQKSVHLKNGIGNVDVELWDSCGEDQYAIYWSAYRKYADGLVFVYNEDNDESDKKLDLLYNYFVGQNNFSLSKCLVCCYQSEDPIHNFKLSSLFSKISQINVNLETAGEKFTTEFGKFVGNLVVQRIDI